MRITDTGDKVNFSYVELFFFLGRTAGFGPHLAFAKLVLKWALDFIAGSFFLSVWYQFLV